MTNPIIKKPRILGIILARGGSKGVPRKNIRPLLGIPLIAYTIGEALRSQSLTRLIVSTEDEEIRAVAIRYGAEVPFLRPAHLATDTAKSVDCVQHVLEWAEQDEGQRYDYIVELLCTNPMKTSEDIDQCVEKLITTEADSAIGVVKLEDHHPIRIKKIVEDRIVDFCCQKEVPGTHRQQLKPDAYIRNGSIYACRRDRLFERVGSANSRPYIMPAERSVNIDSEEDLVLAEIFLKKYPRDYIRPVDQTNNITTPITSSAKGFHFIPTSNQERRVLISTVPFGEYPDSPLDIFKQQHIDFMLNPLGRPPSEEEMIKMISDYGILLAGSSPITHRVLDHAPHLRLIARAGVGFDNVDLNAAKERNIRVTFTPQAPAPAVAEFTIGLMLSLLRFIPQHNADLHAGIWQRRMGRRLGALTVGVLGTGTIGKKVIQLLSGFGTNILAHDLKSDQSLTGSFPVTWTDKETLLKQSDIMTIHTPLTPTTRHWIGWQEFQLMKPDALIVNTARGGIIKEQDLIRALTEKRIAGAALDVFEKEPYQGELLKFENCLLTSHIAAASIDCRKAMETQATEEIIRFLRGEPLLYPVPI